MGELTVLYIFLLIPYLWLIGEMNSHITYVCIYAFYVFVASLQVCKSTMFPKNFKEIACIHYEIWIFKIVVFHMFCITTIENVHMYDKTMIFKVS